MKPRKSFEQKLTEHEQLRQQAHHLAERNVNQMTTNKLRRYVKRWTEIFQRREAASNFISGTPSQGSNNE